MSYLLVRRGLQHQFRLSNGITTSRRTSTTLSAPTTAAAASKAAVHQTSSASASISSYTNITSTWLLTTAGLVIGMIHVGGVTRLTQSGLSMTNWSITGSLPPLNDKEWHVEFERYQQFPEWKQRKNSMTDISDFKSIFWWEYGHRMMGRLIGVVYIVPWIALSIRGGRIPPGFQPRLAMLGGMGATQGLVGWWMVQSGLGDDRRNDTHEIRVKPARLATHLTMAMATYSGLIWTAWDIMALQQKQKLPTAVSTGNPRIRLAGMALTALTATTIVSGALVAGNDAGRAYNTFPKMNDQWIPDEYNVQEATSNTATVQWNHRVLGTATATAALAIAAVGLLRGSGQQKALSLPLKRALYGTGAAATFQWGLGVTTLLTYVPLSLAAAHQLGSVAVLTSALSVTHAARHTVLRSPNHVQAAAKQVAQKIGVPK